MDMQRSKVPAKLLLRLDTDVFEILVAEDNNAPFGNQ